MEKIGCFGFRVGRKKEKVKKIGKPSEPIHYNDELDILQVQELELLINSLPDKNFNPSSFTSKTKVRCKEEVKSSTKSNSCEEDDEKEEEEEEEGCFRSNTGLGDHLSNPEIPREELVLSPNLKRSCSNIETSFVLPKKVAQPFDRVFHYSRSLNSHHSADQVMLKKHSSGQVLPSRSRKLWWKLFLWSHRNSHKPYDSHHHLHDFRLQSGYCSDTPKENQNLKCSEVLQNQWVAFSTESSSLSPCWRVEEWVKGLETPPPIPFEILSSSSTHESPMERSISYYSSSRHQIHNSNFSLSDEARHANSIVQLLNPSSSVAHISGVGLKVIPSISCFSGLRSINLSSNFIVHITPGSLPKGIHALSLSKNKISTIEGLRELTRLRILDLSYNRICRIGHGLSNCRMMKELYLAGNKMSDVEGLHRLLKLAVLDLGFNKVTTTQALGQLVANYNSLLALNLLGNPIQTNICSEEHLQKLIRGLLPNLVYLNKHPIKAQPAREIAMDRVARAALGNGNRRWRCKRRKVSARRVSRK